MSSAIYMLKILLLQTRLHEIDASRFQQLCIFGDFVTFIYAWFQAPVPSEAAALHLMFFKKMLNLNKTEGTPLQEIAQIIIKAMRRHLWYLTEELMLLCLLSKQSLPKKKIQ